MFVGAEQWRRSLVQVALVAIVGSAASVALELFNRHSVGDLVVWSARAPLEATCNAMFAVLLAWAALALTGRVVVSLLLLMAVLGLLGTLHATKLQILGKPLFPWDLVLQYREALALFPQMTASGWGRVALIAGVLVIVGIWWAAKRDRSPLPFASRGLLGVVVVVACWAIFPRVDKALARFGIHHTRWQQSESYRVNGLLLGIALNANTAVVNAPADYGASSVAAAWGSAPRATSAGSAEPPTVIMVMSESFFDATRLPNVKFVDDPIPNVRRLQAQHASGTLFPPVFGGGTANTEFEVLTGHSMRFLPEGSVPYQQYLHRKHPSLASLYAAQGYETVAVHTFHRWFWERDQVYQHLGFERFVGLEDMPEPVLAGSYPSDEMLTAQLIEQFEKRTRPLFMYGISMEAHGPYQAARYPRQTVRFEGPLDADARDQLSSYVDSAHNADRELGVLVDYFSRVETPVFIVFFGDHLPSLPRVLEQTGAITSLKELNLEQRAFIHQVPLLIWSNTPAAPKQLGGFSTSFLGPVVLELTGTPGSRYTDFLSEVHRVLPVMLPGLVKDANGVISAEPPEELAPLERAWWTLEYDQLFGAQYLERDKS
jgi:phosphoglycerol transferase MdoB-like AlkP superfamily enzyme